jgi:DNA-directed RNA polymerase subunit beta'
MSAHGARKGLSDTALRTADSGYLTRRLVDVSQELIIRETDCAVGRDEIPGMWVKRFAEGENDKEEIEPLEERIRGRFAAETVYDKDGNIIVKANHMITPRRSERIVNEGVDANGERVKQVKIRTILTCRCKIGICVKCYGANMASGEAVQVGEAVGIIAAQSIGEPGTQLTMRTFHTGGVAGGDITQGLPRVEELFEARKPKGDAVITEIPGTVQIIDSKKKREVIVTNEDAPEGSKERQKTYQIKYGSRLRVADGEYIEAGAPLTDGSINPHDIIKIRGVRAVQDYMLCEVQKVYRLQGVDINDKHIEVIVRQMLRKIRIEKSGDTDFLPGSLVDHLDFEDMNEELIREGKEPAEGTRVVLGITKSALATNSFLSAASFQETTKVLTDAAIKGKVDPLIGLKENVIIGQLIPAGTGLRRYRSVHLDTDEKIEARKSAEADARARGYLDDEIYDDEPEEESVLEEVNEDISDIEEFEETVLEEEAAESVEE